MSTTFTADILRARMRGEPVTLPTERRQRRLLPLALVLALVTALGAVAAAFALAA